jgi:hypothetical protein
LRFVRTPMRVVGMLLSIPESEQVGFREKNNANPSTSTATPSAASPSAKDCSTVSARTLRGWRQGRAQRATERLARVGHRLRQRAIGADVDGSPGGRLRIVLP